MTTVELKMEYNKHVRAIIQIDELIAGLRYGSLEWSNMLEAKNKIEHSKKNLLVKLNK